MLFTIKFSVAERTAIWMAGFHRGATWKRASTPAWWYGTAGPNVHPSFWRAIRRAHRKVQKLQPIAPSLRKVWRVIDLEDEEA